MFKSYFKIAIRSLFNNKAFSGINIVGLAVGLTTCLLIMLYIIDENSFDRHHKDVNRLFRLASTSNKGESWAAGPGPLAAGVKADFPEVQSSARLLTFPDIATMLVKHGKDASQKQFFETNGYYVDSNFFDIFSYDLKFGNATNALKEPNSIVVSDVLATKFFGNQNPVGDVLLITTPFGEMSYKVTGVFNTKHKSHIPANFYLTMRNTDMWQWVERQTRWTTNNIFFTYIKLNDPQNAKGFERKLNEYFSRKAGEEFKKAGVSKTFFLQPVKDIYLRSHIGNEIGANGNINFLYILGSIAAFILLIACINFMNLSTARSQKRAREVGVRKVIGAKRGMLVGQFLGESFLMAILALALAVFLTALLLPIFNTLANKELQIVDHQILLLWMAVLVIITGLLSGLYPALYLSSFKPILVLKGRIINSFSAATIRRGLVVFQFTVSICLIFGAIVIWQQLGLLKNQQLGFKKDHQIVLPLAQSYRSSEADFNTLKNELQKIAGVGSVTSGSTYPGIPNLSDMLFYPEGKTANDVVDINLSGINNDYIETMGMKIVNGRSFTSDYKTDSASIIINETAAKQLGYSNEDAIGKKIYFDFGGMNGSLQIVGVVANFNFESLHNQIRPHGFTTGVFANKYGYLIASLNGSDYTSILSSIEKTWNKLIPGVPFDYSFIDKDFEANYEKEQRTSSIIVYFTIIAIVIACLGLFGLAAFSAEQRTKEIGVRKVLGASVAGITSLISKEFVRLIIVSIIIALPLAWFFMNKWLQDFAYQVKISWWIFVVAGSLALLIALLTVSFQAIKAALANPVKSLRSE